MFTTDSALVLSRKKVGGSDVIVSLLTEHHGKVRAYANRAREAKSKMASETQPFTFGVATYLVKKEFATLRELSIEAKFDAITSDVEKVFLGTYMLEFVEMALHEGDIVDGLFKRLVFALDALCTAQNLRLFKVVFDLKMLSSLGFKPMINRCSQCGTTQHLVFELSTLHGGLLCDTCFIRDKDMISVSLENLKWINSALKKPYKTVQSMPIDDTILLKLGQWLNAFIEVHVVRKPLKSIQVLKTLDL